MADPTAEQDVRDTLAAMTEALNTGDADTLASLLSDDPGALFLGTDATERWTKQQLVSGIREAMSVGDRPIRAEQGNLSIRVHGDVALTEGAGRFVHSDGRERATRITGVLMLEGGRWKAVHLHASIGIPNEEIFGA